MGNCAANVARGTPNDLAVRKPPQALHGTTCSGSLVHGVKQCASLPRPPQWELLKKTARKLGKAIGASMRVDLLLSETTTGTVEATLGEFTPWHAAGTHECAYPNRLPSGLTPEQKSRIMTNQASPKWCYLGQLWEAIFPRDAKHAYAGAGSARPPPELARWGDDVVAPGVVPECVSL